MVSWNAPACCLAISQRQLDVDLKGTGIEPAVLERFIEEQIYSLPGTDRHREVFTVLLSGSRAVGADGSGLSSWQRLEKAFQTLCCSETSAECRRLEQACAKAMIDAGVDPKWVEADYNNIDELLLGKLGTQGD